MIDDLYQDGTDQVLADRVARPKPEPKPAPPGALSNLAGSIGGQARAGAARAIAGTADVLGAFGQVAGAYPEALGVNPTPEQKTQADAARKSLLASGPNYTSETGQAFRDTAASWMPDAKTTGWASNIIGGLFGFGTELATGGLFAGPLSPLALGVTTGLDEAEKLRQEGVDLGTRTKAGFVTGAANTAMVAAPMGAATRLGAFVKGAVVGEGTMVGQTAAVQTILRHDGYEKIASQYDPFDPALLAMGALPGVIGAIVHGGAPGRGMPAKVLETPTKTEADIKAAVQLSPAEQVASDAFEASPGNLAELRAAIAKEKDPTNRAILEDELGRQTKQAAAVQANPDLVRAARVVQAADATDATRLTHDTDLAGANEHDAALARAHEQLSNGDRVDVSDIVNPERYDPVKVQEAVARLTEDTEVRSALAETRPAAPERAAPVPEAAAEARAPPEAAIAEPPVAQPAPKSGAAPAEPAPPAQAAHVQARVDDLVKSAPDLPVHTPDGERTTLRRAVETFGKTFDAEHSDAKLAQIAAECFLRAGA